ncbi:MAG: DUF211 domain-containing protein [Candidatus Altiarchaeota archaeon]|nr:DUF211 domain-containing protein [Candidatus Altiarchaeota archaeon]
MGNIRKLVLDVAKPLEPTIIEMAAVLSKIEGTAGVNVSVIELDRKVENIRITLKGPQLDSEKLFRAIKRMGAAVHSIDEVATGEEIVDHARTLEIRK